MNTMSRPLGQRGEMNVLLVPVIILAVLFVGVGSFAFWAYTGRQDYKNNVDAKIATAVDRNTQTVKATDATSYAEAAKSPLATYVGPDAYGSVRVSYPKTWSVYVDTSNSGDKPLDAYFHAAFVPSVDSKQTYNLRVQVNSQQYSTVLATYSSQIKAGKVAAVAYAFPKVPAVIGTKLTGAVVQGQQNGGQGTLILLPLRSTTLEVWTESNDYLSDFNTYILPNLSFSP